MCVCVRVLMHAHPHHTHTSFGFFFSNTNISFPCFSSFNSVFKQDDEVNISNTAHWMMTDDSMELHYGRTVSQVLVIVLQRSHLATQSSVKHPQAPGSPLASPPSAADDHGASSLAQVHRPFSRCRHPAPSCWGTVTSLTSLSS